MKCYRMCCHLSRFCQDRLSQNSRHHLKSCLILYSTGTVWTPFFLKLPFAVSIEVWCMDPVFPQTAFSFSVNGLAPPGRLKRQKNGSGELHPLYSTSNKPLKGTGCVLIFILCKKWVKIWCCPNKLERPTASWFCCHQYFHCVMTPGCEQGPHNFLGLKTCLQNFTSPAHLRIVHTFYSHTQKKVKVDMNMNMNMKAEVMWGCIVVPKWQRGPWRVEVEKLAMTSNSPLK